MLQQGLTWLTSVLENFIFSGAFFGWANIYPVLQDEQYFTDSCHRVNVTSLVVNGSVPTCSSQEEALSLVYAITASAGILLAIFVGMLFDSLGMWLTRTLLVNAAALSYLLITISNSQSSYLLYITFPIINAAGYGLMMTNAQIANLFPKLRGMYSMSVAGAFNSASVLYLFMNRMYYAGFNFKVVLYYYVGVYFALNLRTFLLTPKRPVPCALPHNYMYGYKELCARNSPGEKMNEESGADVVNSIDVDPDKRTVKEILREAHFYTCTLALVIVQFVTNFYIATLNSFFEKIFPSHNKEDYTTIFGILQCCSILVAPFNGMLVEYFRQRFSKTSSDYFSSIRACAIGFLMGSCCLICMVICTLIPVASIQIVAMVMQILCKVFFFGVWVAFLTLVFPSKHFGKLFGLTNLINGLFLLLQYPFTLLLTRVTDYNFTVVNSCLLVFSCFSLVHPLYLLRYYGLPPKSQKEEFGFHENTVTIEDEV